MISFSLGDTQTDEESLALIGGLDLSKVYNSKLYTYPISNQDYWSIDIKQIKYGDASFPLIQKDEADKKFAIIDTGTSLLGFPANIYDKFIKSMN